MTRPLHIELPGAVNHVTSRGDRREAIDAGDEERAMFLAVLAQTHERQLAGQGDVRAGAQIAPAFRQARPPADRFLARQNLPAFCFSTDPYS